MKSLQKEAWRWLVPLGITAFMVIILRFVFLFGYVPTESMEPTLEKGSYVLGFRIYGELEVGDIVIFRPCWETAGQADCGSGRRADRT